MFSLVAGFAAQMHKQSATLECEATFSSREKQPRRSPSNEGVKKDWAVVLEESPDQASNDQLTLGVWPTEANASLDEGVPTTSPRDVEEVGINPLSGVVIAPVPLLKSIGVELSKKRLPDQVLVSTYVPPLEMVHSSTVGEVSDLEDVLKVIHC